jgi:short-subunit dehydrogenase
MFISGATGGLGKAFAVECARRGWDLFLTDLDLGRLATLASALRQTYGVDAEHDACDLTDPESRSALLARVRASKRRFRGLINVAGSDYEGLFQERNLEEIRTIVRLNVEATLEVTHALLELMDPSHTFRIITVSSLAAFFPMPVKATYAASKRFLLDFFLALRDEVRSAGATVTVLCPAGLPTTATTIAAIEAQGLMGQLTTQNIGAVASRTIDVALRGRAIFIPGLLNQCLRLVGSVVPSTTLSGVVGWQWRRAHCRTIRALHDGQADGVASPRKGTDPFGPASSGERPAFRFQMPASSSTVASEAAGS